MGTSSKFFVLAGEQPQNAQNILKQSSIALTTLITERNKKLSISYLLNKITQMHNFLNQAMRIKSDFLFFASNQQQNAQNI